MLCILHSFCVVLSLVWRHRPLLSAVYLLNSSETGVRLNSAENVGEVWWGFFSPCGSALLYAVLLSRMLVAVCSSDEVYTVGQVELQVD